MMDNLIVRATEHMAYGWSDTRAIFGTISGTMPPGYWGVIWMAVSCCCGIEGKTEYVGYLPAPHPRIIH